MDKLSLRSVVNHLSNIMKFFKASLFKGRKEIMIEKYIDQSENIFDIYLYINEILRKHTSDLQNALETEYAEDVTWKKSLMQLQDDENFGKKMNGEQKSLIKSLIPKDDKNKYLAFLILLFTEIDSIAGEAYKNGSKFCPPHNFGREKVKVNHLNTLKTSELGRVYFNQKNFLTDIIAPEQSFTLAKGTGENIEKYQNHLRVIKDTGTDTKIEFFKVTDEYINNKVKNKKDNYRIALVPLNGDKNILIKETIKRADGPHIFIHGINNEARYIKLIEDVMENLAEMRVDIVIFPEMLFTEKMVDMVKQQLRKHRDKFILVICGTIWNERKNYSIMLGGNGRKIGTQNKHNRYRADKEFIEDLQLSSADKVINLYDLDGLGRICTPICVDFISDDFFKNLVVTGTNICLVPTYTPSLFDFKQKAIELGKANFAGTFLSNCCSKAKKEKISFCYLPRKEEHTTNFICESKKEDKCKNYTCNKCYIVDVS